MALSRFAKTIWGRRGVFFEQQRLSGVCQEDISPRFLETLSSAK
jgi:hypothetical protein